MPKPKIEMNRNKIIRRLEREGWINRGGANHDVFEHPEIRGIITLPRHRKISIGVARTTAKTAGWLD